MKILFLTLHDQYEASSRVRAYQFIPHLENMGIDCVMEPFWPNEMNEQLSLALKSNLTNKTLIISEIFLKNFQMIFKRFATVLSAHKYDAVFVQKDVLPFGLQNLLVWRNPNIIFDFCDTIWEMTWRQKKRPTILKMYYRYQIVLFHKMLKRAKIILAENSYLADYARRFNSKVTVINMSLDTNFYTSLATPGYQNNIILGWVGSSTTTYLLKNLTNVLERIGGKYNNIELHNIGGDPMELGSVKVKNIRWHNETIQNDLAKLDIGLMPLDNHPYNRGRLGTKMVIYMSFGIPYVAQDIGLNREITNPGVNGFLASTEDDWVEKLSQFIENKELRQELGRNGRKIAVEQFDIKKQIKKYLDLFYEVKKI